MSLSISQNHIAVKNGTYVDCVSDFCGHTFIPAFENIDNTKFKALFAACAQTWKDAFSSGGVVYQSLSTDGTDYMQTSVNPMLYATRNNKKFTTTERDIYAEIIAGEQGQTNCITLCNMILMGIEYKHSRLYKQNNTIGKAGYAFDICKLINGTKTSSGDGYYIDYNPDDTLDINTFQKILTQKDFFDTYAGFGLVKTVKTKKTATDGQIWYSDIRPGDILWNDSHTVFCLDVSTNSSGTTTITYMHATSTKGDDLRQNKITVKTDGTFTNDAYSSGDSEYKKITQVARPYYAYVNNMFIHDYVDDNITNERRFNQTKYRTLRGATAIPSGADLKNYLTVGEYYFKKIEDDTKTVDKNEETFVNDGGKKASISHSFRLTVENLLGNAPSCVKGTNTWFLQTIRTDVGYIYTRLIKSTSNSISYDSWRKIETTKIDSI
jgi:hypothetical protein